MVNNQQFGDFWAMIQNHLGYTGKEIELFKNNPRNSKILKQHENLLNKTIIFEVVESHVNIRIRGFTWWCFVLSILSPEFPKTERPHGVVNY